MDDIELTYPRGSKLHRVLSLSSKTQEMRATVVLKSFEMRECQAFTELPQDDEVDGRTSEMMCQCGRPMSAHTQNPVSEISPETESKQWQVLTHTNTKQTNAYGEIEFPGYSVKPAKYVRLQHKTDPKDIVNLMTEWWGLRPPNLLISVTGGAKDFVLTNKLKAVFRSGLTKVALGTNAWIITGGTHTGVMKHVGEAVRDYTLGSGSYGRRSIVNIGVAPWGVVHDREKLINKGGQSGYKVHYTVEDPDGSEASLDPNHSHFILVDDGTVNKYGTEIDLRGKLERAISEIDPGTGKDDDVIPTVCLVLEGGPGTLQTVNSALKNNTPVVIVAGSGRAADLLAWAVRNIPVDNPNSALKKLKSEVQSIFAGLKHLETLVDLVLDCMTNRYLITVFELGARGSAMDIDVAILHALLEAKRADERGQLHLSLAMNRIDIAETVMNRKGKTWKAKDQYQLLEKAFINNQVDFVKLFIENGVNLRVFLTVTRLTILYNKIPKTTLLHRLLTKVALRSSRKRSRAKLKFSLRDVGQLIKGFVDSTYEVQYLRNKTYQGNDGDGNGIDGDEGDSNCLERPRGELFLWAVLLNRHDMARLFLEEMSDAMAASLLASRILKCMADKETDVDDRLALLEKTEEYEQLAYDILTECYRDDEEATLLLLLRPLDFWGNSTCLRLAISADDKNYVAHTAVQELLSRIWYGNVDKERISTFSFICCLLFPPLVYCLLTFRESKDEEDTDEDDDVFGKKDRNDTEVDGNLDGIQLELIQKSDEDLKKGRTLRAYNDGIDIRARQHISPLKKFVGFLNSPVVKFSYATFWYVIFLLLFSRFLLVDYSSDFSIMEIVLIVWVSTFVCDEIRQVFQRETPGFCTKIKSWISEDYWNVIDLLGLVCFYVALIVKYLADVDAGRYVLAVDILFFYIRIMHIFSINRTIGPKLIMIGKMMVDLLFFVGIICVIMIGYGVSVQAILYPDEKDTLSILEGIFYKPYFQIYGELFLEEIEGCTTNTTLILAGVPRCRKGHVFAIILLAIYMVLSNVLLLNLLIAMFSYTFSKVQDHTDLYWKFQRYGLIMEYQWRPMLSPPLIILSHIRLCIQGLLSICFKRLRAGKRTLRQRLTADENSLLNLFELINMEKYFAKKEQVESSAIDVGIKEVTEKVDTLMKHVEFLESKLDTVTTDSVGVGDKLLTTISEED